MTRNDRRAGRYAGACRGVIARSAVLAAVLALILATAPVSADWTSEHPVVASYETQPALAMDSSGNLGVAWEHWGTDPGIRFATDVGGAWAVETVSTGDDSRPDLVFDADGKAHAVFARDGTDPGLYYATNAGGTWQSVRLHADADPWTTSMAIDAGGKLHVAYSSLGFTPGIWYYTNAGGTWAGTRLTTSTWDSEPSLDLDPDGHVVVAFARYEPSKLGVFIHSNTTGAWTEQRVTTVSFSTEEPAYDDYPALRVDAAGKAHIAYLRYYEGSPNLQYATNESGSWAHQSLGVPGGTYPGVPALGLDAAGDPEIVIAATGYVAQPDQLYRYGGPQLLVSGALFPPGERRSNFPDILRDATGRLTVAYRNAWHEPGMFVHRESPDEDTMVVPSVIADAPSMVASQDAYHIAYERYATDDTTGTAYVTNQAGPWVDVTIDDAEGPPDIGSAWTIATPTRLLTRSGDTWNRLDYAVPGREATIAGDVVVYATDGGLRAIPPDGAITSNGSDSMLSLGAGGYIAQYLLAFVRDGIVHGMYGTETYLGVSWGQPFVVDSRHAHDPDTSGYGDDSVIAYDRNDANPGIYVSKRLYDDEWFTQRLTRSWADGWPSVFMTNTALQPWSVTWVAWQRACWGPAPGIYVATDRDSGPGQFTITRVVDSCTASDPSIFVLPGGQWVLAYREASSGIMLLEEGAAARSMPAGSAPIGPARAEPGPAVDEVPVRGLGEGAGSLAPSPGGSARGGPGMLGASAQRAP